MSIENYILLGPPGSGKSTQAELLSAGLGLRHIDIGSALRAAAEEDTPFGHMVNATINKRRELVSDDIVKAVLEKALKNIQAPQGILLDGAPRRASQIDKVTEALRSVGRTISWVIFIDLSEEESIERISKRYLCLSCHKPYIFGKDIFSTEAVCDACGGKIGQRTDDTPAGVRKRFQIFQAETLPVADYFEKAKTLLRVDGHQDAQAIYQDIIRQKGR
ncbi:MAG: hypothetical protein A3E38_02405 [Candidatus Moranbacteria bacterium RIFCSPHIGHO2_12_FULL_54_9]|nr:MAG: hypothetical protein A2878_01760 [Candidatus Moranbacteria bacterium RIFCSPHIGHO2_01_FULL_54_31]OGI25298.1 MAG: hypothetical protein A3E38_02405 [Candidatus Moranbacteria bacterium RIFCSPHIGHO2_12_FULL_54_9]